MSFIRSNRTPPPTPRTSVSCLPYERGMPRASNGAPDMLFTNRGELPAPIRGLSSYTMWVLAISERGRRLKRVRADSLLCNAVLEALHILRRLVVSNTPLTDVFLPKPKAVEDAFDALKLSPEDIVIDKKDTSKKMSLKLLINKSKNKVLYAEATNDFLDLLFSFLTIPLGSVVKLLGPGSSIRCLDNLHKSVEDLSGSDDCIISEECKAMLLDPKLSVHSGCDNQLLPVVEGGPKTIDSSKFSRCIFCLLENSHYSGCSGLTNRALHFINPKVRGAATECGGGFVRGPKMKFMVTDGLDVKPLSFISVIPILDRFNVPISDVQKRVVSVGEEEALSLLKASLLSKTVLSDVFCQKEVNQSMVKLERKW